MTASLSDTLEPAEHHRVGPLGRAGQLLEHLDLGGHQLAGVVRQQGRDVVHRGLLAVHHPEAVGDEGTGRSIWGSDEFGQLPGQRQALVVVLAGFARVEADVLQQQDVAVGQSLGAGQRVGPDDIAGQLDVTAQLLAQRLRDGCQRELRVRAVLGPAEVGGDDDLGAGIGQRLERRAPKR